MDSNQDLASLQEEFSVLLKEFTQLKRENDFRSLMAVDTDAGDSAMMLFSSTLVMLMTLPGISLFYSGAVKVRHVLSTFIQCMAVSSIISVIWMICGYSLAFGPSNEQARTTSIFGDFSAAWFQNMNINSYHQSAPFVPESMFCMFQLTNAIISCALIVGGYACRVKFIPSLIFVCLWLLLVYCPLSHTHRHPDGFLFKEQVLDFAGGNVVHISAGMTALVTSYLVGPSKDTEAVQFETRNMLLSVWGACFLWIGWFGFNVGSAYAASECQAHDILRNTTQPSPPLICIVILSLLDMLVVCCGAADGNAAMTVLITMIGATASVISWTSTEWIVSGRPSILGAANSLLRHSVYALSIYCLALCRLVLFIQCFCRLAQWGHCWSSKHIGG
jgi:ammonium transporter, Amt family